MSSIAWLTIENAIQSWITSGSGLDRDRVIWAGQSAPTGQCIMLKFTAIAQRGRDHLERVENVLTITPQAITSVSIATDTLTLPGHGLQTGDGPVRFSTTGTLPAPLDAATSYWVVAVDANTIKVAATFLEAVNGAPSSPAPSIIDLTSTGSGTTQIKGTTSTVRAGQEIAQRLHGQRLLTLSLQCFGGTSTGASSALAVLHDALSSYGLDAQAAALQSAGVGIATIDPIQLVDDPAQPDLHASATAQLHISAELVEFTTHIEHVKATSGVTGTTLSLV